MPKIELTISPDYVPTWTIADAVRELFQNALDQEKLNPASKAGWSYCGDTNTLMISNMHATLSIKSLLLGQTTKADSTETIGHFGEGYKIAVLVLLRNNKTVTIYNYGAGTIWTPSLVKSRKFNGAAILTFNIKRMPVDMYASRVEAGQDADKDLIIEVQGISKEEYQEQIVPTNLHLRSDWNILHSTQYGSIIDLPGKIFVGGLYVRDYAPLEYGYNFAPEHLNLGRDRNMTNEFELLWHTANSWLEVDDLDKTLELITRGCVDVKYVASKEYHNSTKYLRSSALDQFWREHGVYALPCVTQEDLAAVPESYKGVIVPAGYKALIMSHPDFIWPEPDSDDDEVSRSTLRELHDWFISVKPQLSQDSIQQFHDIYTKLDSIL